jgi:energy-coupling factor transport system permease protein
MLLPPLTPDPRAPLAAANPLAKLAAAFVVLVVLLVSVDAVTAAVILAALIALIPASGVNPRSLAARAWPIPVMAVSIAVLNTIFAPSQEGAPLIAVGPLRVGVDTAMSGLALGLRLLAIGAAGLLATVTTQPIDLADALVQQARVSPRFAVGALAGFRLLPALARDRQTAALARRARGVDAGRTPVSATRYAGGLLFALLVAAVRRAGRLALAMDARGFGAQPCRTVVRVQRMRPADWAWVAGAVALCAAAIAISASLAAWRPLVG